VEVSKAIAEAFSGAPIPKGAADFRVTALKIDVQGRRMRTRLFLSRVPEYRVITELKKTLKAHYALNEIETVITFSPEAGAETEAMQNFVVGHIAEALPVVEYVLKDSVWQETADTISICLHHGGKEVLQSVSGRKLHGPGKALRDVYGRLLFRKSWKKWKLSQNPCL